MSNIVRLSATADEGAPSMENGQLVRGLPPRRQCNADARSQEHLAPGQVERLISAAGTVGRYSHRDSTLLLFADLARLLSARSRDNPKDAYSVFHIFSRRTCSSSARRST
jgi:hypothetical protein